MSLGLKSIAAAAAAVLATGAGAASAQPYYGYGQLPPAPYQVYGGGYYGGGGGCGGDRFTLLGAHAGVTVLGVDFGGGLGISVPYGDYCGAAQQESYAPRPYAPVESPPAAYGPPPAYPQYAPQSYAPAPAYGYQGYAAQSYGPPPQAYPSPCGCGATGW